MRKIIAAGISAGLLSGCYTMEHLGNVGEGYERGDYVSSSIMLVLTPLMLVPDVFTFGGLMDADQSAEVWTGAAAQYSNSSATGNTTGASGASCKEKYSGYALNDFSAGLAANRARCACDGGSFSESRESERHGFFCRVSSSTSYAGSFRYDIGEWRLVAH